MVQLRHDTRAEVAELLRQARADADADRADARRMLADARTEVQSLTERRDAIARELNELSGVIEELAETESGLPAPPPAPEQVAPDEPPAPEQVAPDGSPASAPEVAESEVPADPTKRTRRPTLIEVWHAAASGRRQRAQEGAAAVDDRDDGDLGNEDDGATGDVYVLDRMMGA